MTSSLPTDLPADLARELHTANRCLRSGKSDLACESAMHLPTKASVVSPDLGFGSGMP